MNLNLFTEDVSSAMKQWTPLTICLMTDDWDEGADDWEQSIDDRNVQIVS